MPIIQIQLFGSLTVEQKETLIKETSDAAAHALNVPLPIKAMLALYGRAQPFEHPVMRTVMVSSERPSS